MAESGKVRMNKHNGNLFFFKTLILMFQPIIFTLVAAVVWALLYKLRHRRVIQINALKYTAVIILYIFQIDAIKTAFLLFRYSRYTSLYLLNLVALTMTHQNIHCYT